MAGIVDAAVVTEVVEEATVRIDAARVVERHRVGDQLLHFIKRGHRGERALAGNRQRTDCSAEAQRGGDRLRVLAEGGETCARPTPLQQADQHATDEGITGRGSVDAWLHHR
ncbi:hypothetical protein G6F66_014791 [Rhizopus arrhizus]|nr:hypothetical protein G6F66_014791 [Rhizopus arrhizus]